MATCGICHEDDLAEIGELDSCPHRFCFPCIKQWSEIENRCPFCKSRFGVIRRKQLEAASPRSSPRNLNQLAGIIVETIEITEKDQRPDGGFGEGDNEPDPMEEVFCTECGLGDDDEHLLLCDRCDDAVHSYCAGLRGVPEGSFFCRPCTAFRDEDMQEDMQEGVRGSRRVQDYISSRTGNDSVASEVSDSSDLEFDGLGRQSGDSPSGIERPSGSRVSLRSHGHRRTRSQAAAGDGGRFAEGGHTPAELHVQRRGLRSERSTRQTVSERLVSGSRTVLNQRQAAASGSLLDFARTLERRADSHLREANGGVISRAASEDLRRVDAIRENYQALRRQDFAPGAHKERTAAATRDIDYALLAAADGGNTAAVAAAWEVLQGVQQRSSARRNLDHAAMDGSPPRPASFSDFRAELAVAKARGHLLSPSNSGLSQSARPQKRPSLRHRSPPRQTCGPSSHYARASGGAAPPRAAPGSPPPLVHSRGRLPPPGVRSAARSPPPRRPAPHSTPRSAVVSSVRGSDSPAVAGMNRRRDASDFINSSGSVSQRSAPSAVQSAVQSAPRERSWRSHQSRSRGRSRSRSRSRARQRARSQSRSRSRSQSRSPRQRRRRSPSPRRSSAARPAGHVGHYSIPASLPSSDRQIQPAVLLSLGHPPQLPADKAVPWLPAPQSTQHTAHAQHAQHSMHSTVSTVSNQTPILALGTTMDHTLPPRPQPQYPQMQTPSLNGEAGAHTKFENRIASGVIISDGSAARRSPPVKEGSRDNRNPAGVVIATTEGSAVLSPPTPWMADSGNPAGASALASKEAARKLRHISIGAHRGRDASQEAGVSQSSSARKREAVKGLQKRAHDTALEAVKELLRPLFRSKRIDSAVYKAVAASATRVLYDDWRDHDGKEAGKGGQAALKNSFDGTTVSMIVSDALHEQGVEIDVVDLN